MALCLLTAVSVCSQEAKKPRKQANAKETVHKPKQQAEKAPAVRKGKPTAKAKKPMPSKKKPVVQQAIPSARYVAVKTNVPFLAVAVQNLAVEVQLARHISLDLPVMWSISDIERRHALRTIALQPEARWWLKSVGTGHFFGVHAHAAWFNVKWEDDRYQTEKRPLIGAGLSYGYKLPLSAHWGAEFNVGAGYANMQYNTYYNLDNGAWIDTRTRHYWGITRAGISLVYRF